MTFLWIFYFVFMVLFLFGITIFIHELGHFLVARRLGMRADVFSIGFGHALWKKEYNGVVYKIGWIPFGGYVALPQMEPRGGRTIDENGNEVRLPRVKPWKKILVALAGAAGNMVLAFGLAWIIFLAGKPSSLKETSSVVGFVSTNSMAYAAGIRMGDEIIAINGNPITAWDEVSIEAALEDRMTLTVRRGTESRDVELETEMGAYGINWLRGLRGLDGASYCKVGSLVENSSALKAGTQPKDLIVEFDGEKILSIPHLKHLVQSREGLESEMVVERGGDSVTLLVTPTYDEERGAVLIGVGFDLYHLNRDRLIHPTPVRQIRSHSSLIFKTLGALITPKYTKNAAKAISGPPSIFQYLYAMLKSGLIMALWFTCLLNVNLAIINLMPLPVLDGGHIVFSLIEMIFRRPVHERIVTGLTMMFAVALIAAMIFLSVRDVGRIKDLYWPSDGDETETEPEDIGEDMSEPAGE